MTKKARLSKQKNGLMARLFNNNWIALTLQRAAEALAEEQRELSDSYKFINFQNVESCTVEKSLLGDLEAYSD